MRTAKRPHHFDVVVIGAGPGGAATALRLAKLGHRVAIVERSRFPRPHVGICLSDQTLALLAYLGLDEAFTDTKPWRRRITHVNWGVDGSREVDQPGFHVDRGTLDQAILKRACEAGATVLQPAQVVSRELHDKDGWTVMIKRGTKERNLRAHFLVDAGGRRSAMGGRRVKDSPPLLALHATWTFNTPPEADGLIEACDFGWLWFAQIHPDQGSLVLFLDPQAADKLTKSSLRTWYLDRLTSFGAARAIGSWCLASEAKACDATSTHAKELVTHRYIRVGDAAMTVDPLASQGVHLALLSGIQAAVVVNTILKEPSSREIAQSFYRARVIERVAKYKARTCQEYARVAANIPSRFWLERCQEADRMDSAVRAPRPMEVPGPVPPSSVAVSTELMIKTAPVIDGDIIRERRTLHHPNLESEVKYLGGVDLVRLLETLPKNHSYSHLMDTWRPYLETKQAMAVAAWLLERGILLDARQDLSF